MREVSKQRQRHREAERRRGGELEKEKQLETETKTFSERGMCRNNDLGRVIFCAKIHG
tara:strand:+ start:549 stop:722 length:174 start_codon:yes stop_codon:yes gene_type:complete